MIPGVPSMGGLELIIILAVILLFFGAKRLPQLGRSLGSGMREFRKGASGVVDDEDNEELQEHNKEEKPSLNGVANSDEGLAHPEKYSREENIRTQSKA